MNAKDQYAIPDQTTEDEGGLELGQIFGALRRRVLVIAGVTTVVTSAAVLKALTDEPVYQSSFELLTPAVTLESRLISISNPDGLSGQEDLLTASVDDTKLRVLKSPRILEPVLETLQVDHPSLTYGQLFRGLSINLSSDEILAVRYQDVDPVLVEDVLDVVSEAYIDFSREDRQSDILRGIAFVDEQLPQLRERVDTLQAELEALRIGNNLIDPALQGEQVSQQVATFTAEQVNIQIQLEEAQQLYTDLRQEFSQRGVTATASVLSEDARYQELQNQLLEIDRQIAQSSALLREESPEIQTLLSQRQNLIPLVRSEGDRVQRQMENYIRELNIRYQALDEAIELLNTQINNLSSVTRQYTDIQRELDIATTNLNEFLTKREALRIDAAQRQAPWEILTQPGSPRASAASVKQNLVLGGVLGLLLGVGVALLLDKLKSVIHSSKDVKTITRLPLLGNIPHNSQISEFEHTASTPLLEAESWLGQILPNQQSLEVQPELLSDSAPFNESFRLLFTNIQLLKPDDPIQALTVSSAIPNEGKSTVAIHLAQAAASMGRKVLIVDADLRRPSLHRFLGLENKKGLVDWVGFNMSLESLLQQSAQHHNLFFLSAGSPPPDSTSILASKEIPKLLDEAKSKFDLLIFDTPPLLGFADAYLVIPQTQGLLLVTGIEKVKRAELTQAVESLKVSNVPVLGAVANGTKEKENFTYTYYQYYSVPRTEEALAPLEEGKTSQVSRLVSSVNSLFRSQK